MLSASFFSLISPALDAAEVQFDSSAAPAAIVCVAILLAMGAVALMNEKRPHEHFGRGHEGPEAASLRRVWLVVIAFTIHNFPEGLAVGVGFGAHGLAGGMPLAPGIGLQNAPEGLAVAVALPGEGYPERRARGLAFAAGAMLHVISHEIFPQTHRSGHQNKATPGLVIMLLLDVWLG